MNQFLPITEIPEKSKLYGLDQMDYILTVLDFLNSTLIYLSITIFFAVFKLYGIKKLFGNKIDGLL